MAGSRTPGPRAGTTIAKIGSVSHGAQSRSSRIGNSCAATDQEMHLVPCLLGAFCGGACASCSGSRLYLSRNRNDKARVLSSAFLHLAVDVVWDDGREGALVPCELVEPVPDGRNPFRGLRDELREVDNIVEWLLKRCVGQIQIGGDRGQQCSESSRLGE